MWGPLGLSGAIVTLIPEDPEDLKGRGHVLFILKPVASPCFAHCVFSK